MFKRLRPMEITLAAKCRLLFGAAVILILSAALFVPWQRMEQLMEQMNKRTGRTLAEWAEADHAARQLELKAGTTATRPAVSPGPTTQAAITGAREKATVKLILLKDDSPDLPRFERKALELFRQDPYADPLTKRQEHSEGPPSYRYARQLYARPSCMSCHAGDLPKTSQVAATGTSDQQVPVLGIASIEIPYQVDENQVLLNRFLIITTGVGAGAVAMAVFYWITTRLILSPVRVLRRTAEKVSQGDLSIRSDISTGDEFQKLSETFNRMLGNLKQSEDQLRAINKSLDLKLGELEQSNLALYESNRLKSEFLANVSHELRTPLNSILGFAELLKDSVAEDAKAQRFVQNIISSGKSLLELINDLLDLAKIEAGKMEVRSEPLSLSDLFEGLITIIKPLAEKKDLEVISLVAREVPILHTDAAKLQQVLYNFLSNAIKFSPAGGRIEVRAERPDEEHVRIAVSDQGPGIPEDKQSLIFEKFRQIDGSATREHGGTGLGLAISKELVTLLAGTIGMQSKSGEGATFWVVLPVKIQAAVVSRREAPVGREPSGASHSV